MNLLGTTLPQHGQGVSTSDALSVLLEALARLSQGERTPPSVRQLFA